MKRLGFLPAVVVSLAVGLTAHGEDLITSVAGGNPASPSGECGYRIRPNVDVRVTGLSFYDVGQDGLATDYSVTLWNDTGTILGRVTVGTNSPLNAAGFRTENLASPVTLTAGTIYRLSSTGGDTVWGNPDPLYVTASPEITILTSFQDTPVSLSPLGHTIVQGPRGEFPADAKTGCWIGPSLTFGPPNDPPTADAGPDQEVECSGPLTAVALDGTASSDPDGDPVGFEWSLPEGSNATIDDPFSATPVGQFPLGPTLVTLTVTDGNGGFDVTDVLVTVIDTVPPVLVATTDKIALWPPNHEMHEVLVSVEITDCAWDTGITLTAWVSSSEPDDATGDGSYTGDVDGQDGFAAPVPVDLIYTGEPEPGVYLYEGLVSLRAERDGGESSRVYSIVCDIEDLAGNTSTASCVVVVPHDRRKK
jgi:hypothetical protein